MRVAILIILTMIVVAGTANAALIAYYNFGIHDPSTENWGTAGTAADGILMNGATIVDIDPGFRGIEWALKLDATAGHQYMNIGSDWFNTAIPTGHPVTIAAWIQTPTSTTATWNTIASKGYETSWCLSTGTPQASPDKVTFSVHEAFPASSPLKGTVSVRNDTNWYHVVATIDGADHKTACLYINGVLQESRQSWYPCYSSDVDILIGDEPLMQDYDFQWNGYIDDVRIYDDYFDAQQAYDLFRNTTDPSRWPPDQASSPSPADSAKDVSITADLSWTAGSNATSHDVYFGTNPTPDSNEFQGNQTATTFDPGTMAKDTTYYWRIDEIGIGGTTAGNVWSFTSEPLFSGLLAYYDFTDTEGLPTTSNEGLAGTAADGLLTNGASIVYDPVGQWNKDPNYVLLLNYGNGTVHQYMNIGSDWFSALVPNGYPLTITAWIKVTPGTLGSWRTIMSKGFETTWNLSMGTAHADEDKIAFSVHQAIASWNPLKGTVNVRDGQWHHVAGTIDDADYKTACLYIDGVLQESRLSVSPVNTNVEDILIGDEPIDRPFWPDDNDVQWNGMIDDVRIYDEVLSEAVIRGVYMGHPPDIALTVNVEPNDVGIDTVTPSPGEYMYYQNQQVPLTVNNFVDCPDVYKFEHWEGDVVDANATETVVVMSEDKTVTAVFVDSRECGDECHPILQGDLNGDCHIDFEDFAIYCEQWLACTAPECD
jgi:hypothetical protein